MTSSIDIGCRHLRPARFPLLLTAALLLSGCQSGSDAGAPPLASESGRYGWVDASRVADADKEPGNWYTNGRDQSGSYHSPLTQIDSANVGRLGYAWSYDLATARGQEATPIVVDGVMYAVGIWGRVYALDAATGRELWTFLPEIDGQYGRYACCDVVQRGLAVWKGKVYAGATDGHLHALDARTGKLLWRADTLPAEARRDHKRYTSSGSPQIAGNVVVIGNGGADFSVRGFVTAFDLETGKLAWRFYTVPRNPKEGPQEAPHLDHALKTWDPAGSWTEHGGGGTAWDGMAYDPKLDLLYVGTGNAAPYDYHERSPKGGDNLYLASILAIRPKTGQLAWYFQQIPGERWDYTATQKFILADIEVEGRQRQVIMQAPKNGFFYVLDRKTGEFLSGKPFIPLNWTRGLDAKGRPIHNPRADYTTGPKLIAPSFAGGHNWQPMSRDPRTGLVYIPGYEEAVVMVDSAKRPIGSVPGQYTLYPIYPDSLGSEEVEKNIGPLPSLATLAAAAGRSERSLKPITTIKAFDPLSGRIAWQERTEQFMASGIMTTDSGLLITGRADGGLTVMDSASGRLLKRIETGSSILAAPMTYSVKGRQYVAVMAGYGGGAGFSFPEQSAAFKHGNANRILVFALDGKAVPIPPKPTYAPINAPARWKVNAADEEAGRKLFFKNCGGCHSFGPGLVPDLRRMNDATHEMFDSIVLEGLLAPNGMGRFDDTLSRREVRQIHGYIVAEGARADGAKLPGAKSGRAQ
jgi:quinohemoprotein ethanol dehydrogenase